MILQKKKSDSNRKWAFILQEEITNLPGSGRLLVAVHGELILSFSAYFVVLDGLLGARSHRLIQHSILEAILHNSVDGLESPIRRLTPWDVERNLKGGGGVCFFSMGILLTWLMFSTPPTSVLCLYPALMERAAKQRAFIEEEHTLLTATAWDVLGIPEGVHSYFVDNNTNQLRRPPDGPRSDHSSR